jgi:8-amino-7-oxononanoate synthase
MRDTATTSDETVRAAAGATAAGDGLWAWLDEEQAARSRSGLLRELRSRPADHPALDLAGNDYLGLSRHPAVVEAAVGAARTWGTGSTGSRLVTGTTTLHTRLEQELADFCGFEAGLVFSSGYCANIGALTALTRPGTLIVSDERNHASVIDGCRLARAEVAVVPHRDPDAVRKTLAGHAGRALVVTDSVFSVDGEPAPLPELAAVCREYGAVLLTDDAHGLGVTGGHGQGAPAAAGLAGAPDVLATVTLSKSLGSQGGALLGPRRVIEHVINAARTFIFDTGLAPAAAAGALEALRLLRAEPALAHRVRANADRLRALLAGHGLPVGGAPGSAVVSVRAPSAGEAAEWAAAVRAAGIEVGCFRPPSVPDGVSRLRLTAHAALTDAELERVARTVRETMPGTPCHPVDTGY